MSYPKVGPHWTGVPSMLLSTTPAEAFTASAQFFARTRPKLVLQLLSTSPLFFDHCADGQPVLSGSNSNVLEALKFPPPAMTTPESSSTPTARKAIETLLITL